RVNEKYISEYYILNRAGVIVTTNYRDAFYLRPDDRRHYVAFSERQGDEYSSAFWTEFWAWYKADGFKHVAALLYQYDLSNFDPKAEPPKTPAFWDMVWADRGEECGELADAIDNLKQHRDDERPKALTIAQLLEKAPALEWLH